MNCGCRTTVKTHELGMNMVESVGKNTLKNKSLEEKIVL